jgi:hypothetical protein
MAERNDASQDVQPRKLEYGETHPSRNDLEEQRGGSQDNQITGQTERGAENQDNKGRNPPGRKTDNR